MYGPGETLTYAVQRLLTRRSLAREFSRSEISNPPFANETARKTEAFKRLEADGFRGWTLSVDGLVAHPTALTLADLKRLPIRHQITQLACEEGWSYVAEWIGTPLIEVLNAVGILSPARWGLSVLAIGGQPAALKRGSSLTALSRSIARSVAWSKKPSDASV